MMITEKNVINKKMPVKIGKYKLYMNKDNPINSFRTYLEIFKHKDHTKVKNFPSKNDKLIIDIGANEGYYTLKAREMAPKAKIVSLEPNPFAFAIMKKNITANRLKNIILVNKAVGNRIGKIKFEIIKERSTVCAEKIYEKYRKEYTVKKISVSSINLDHLCKRYDNIDLIKIDTEGSEFSILKNSQKTLRKVNRIVLEYHEAQKTEKPIKALLLKLGFRLVLQDRAKYRGDLYFEKYPIS